MWTTKHKHAPNLKWSKVQWFWTLFLCHIFKDTDSKNSFSNFKLFGIWFVAYLGNLLMYTSLSCPSLKFHSLDMQDPILQFPIQNLWSIYFSWGETQTCIPKRSAHWLISWRWKIECFAWIGNLLDQFLGGSFPPWKTDFPVWTY